MIKIKKPKPLGKGRLADINQAEAAFVWFECAKMIGELLSAEQYWRERVRNCLPGYSRDGSIMYCAFCDAAGDLKHEPDCPWLIANQ